VRARLERIEGMVESADQAPTATAGSFFDQYSQALDQLLNQWNQLKSTTLPAVNQQLSSAGLPAIVIGNEAGSPAGN
jgi:hypothetical protein